MRVGLSEPICMSVHMYGTLFLPNKCFPCFTTSHLCGNSFLQSERARVLSLTAAPVAWIWCSNCLTSVSGWELKPRFKLLLAEAT